MKSVITDLQGNPMSSSEIMKPSTYSIENAEHIMQFSSVLRGFVDKNGLSVKIQDRSFVKAAGWRFAGMNFGLTALPKKPKRLDSGNKNIVILYSHKEFRGKWNKVYTKEVPVFASYNDDMLIEARSKNKISREVVKPFVNYECETEVQHIATKNIVSYGYATCSNLELLKVSFDEYAIVSMSQTRSASKAYRNLLDYIFECAGFEPTPLEEMEEEEIKENVKSKKGNGNTKITPNAGQWSKAMDQLKKKKGEDLNKYKENIKKHMMLSPEQLKEIENVKGF